MQYARKQELLDSLQKLPISSQKQVFMVLQTHGLKFTENNNGVFFNLTQCGDDVWLAMQRVLDQNRAVTLESEERDKKIRELQQILKSPKTELEVPTVPEPPPTAPPPSGKGKKNGASAAVLAKRDILSMLAK